MKGSHRAFTLLELLVVLAIIVVVSSTLLPVFYSARQAARATVCLSNFGQVYNATQLYLSDYDDTYMPVNHQPATEPNSSNDRTWVQLILPYINNFGIFRCPADDNDRPRREASFDSDLVPGDTYSQYYTASLRTNVGFNFVYFSPIYEFDDRWDSRPRTSTEVSNPSQTYLFIDSVWALKEDGTPTGGGSWLVVPPCRYDLNEVDTFITDTQVNTVFTNDATGWDVGQIASPLQYGGTWPWHRGRMTPVSATGSARSLTSSQISDGCDLKPSWQGHIDKPDRYQWDLK
ncbi:MAG: hypothetical protein QOJ65_503 [Fimbriimonadaceae bacterium]|nr:hypothetical protein [Fimbriimonadaceae bacterium]